MAGAYGQPGERIHGRVPTTRLAPSPTGALHLGNARTFLVNWAMARAAGWRVVLRIEDLDTPRNKPGALAQAIEDLSWLGMDWDVGPIVQSEDLAPHRAALEALAASGRAFPSELSRAQIEAVASAPQENAGAHEVYFSASLRPELGPRRVEDERTNWRLVVAERDVEFVDLFAGPQRHRPCDTVGDFVVWTSRGQPSYQLAVVVDDFRQGVTHVVRGDDLLESTARQVLLHEALGLSPVPVYGHLPLVRGPDGKRLAKRHGDTRLSRYRAAGVAAERVIGLCGFWCGLTGRRTLLSAAEFRAGLNPATIPRHDIIMSPEDEQWLLDR